MPIIDKCRNCFDQIKCDPWIIEKLEFLREIKTPSDKNIIDDVRPRDFPGKADEICSKCNNFEKTIR
jgi:hypothetical protein